MGIAKYVILVLLVIAVYKAGKGIKKIIGIVLAAFIAYMIACWMGYF